MSLVLFIEGLGVAFLKARLKKMHLQFAFWLSGEGDWRVLHEQFIAHRSMSNVIGPRQQAEQDFNWAVGERIAAHKEFGS